MVSKIVLPTECVLLTGLQNIYLITKYYLG